MKTIYCLSGLGADKRAFQNLIIPNFKLFFIEWISPFKNESMKDYAFRLSTQITGENPILLGLSFGGMIAMELSKLLDTKAVILLSSAKSKAELHPKFERLMRWNLIKLLPKPLLHRSNFLLEYAFGVSAKRDKAILAEIVADTDLDFLFWALNAMQHWHNRFIPKNLLEIHGTNDRIIPYRNLPEANSIKGGGHLMVLDRAEEVSNIILKYLRGFNDKIQY